MKGILPEALRSFYKKLATIEKLAYELIKNLRTLSLSDLLTLYDTLRTMYEEARVWACSNIPKIGEHMPFAPHIKRGFTFKTDINAFLWKIITGCKSARGGIEILLKPEVPSKVLSNINLLREELEKLLEEGLEENIAHNLEEAISELELGHYLASALIASRVIVHLIDKTSTEEVRRVLKLDKERIEDEDRVKYLIKIGAIPKEREDEQRRLIFAMHRSRNYLSHRIYLFPKPEEALTLLSGAFEFARIMLKVPIKD